LFFQAFFVFLLFQKKRIEGGKKFKRKNIFSNDFDIFVSCPSSYPVNPQQKAESFKCWLAQIGKE